MSSNLIVLPQITVGNSAVQISTTAMQAQNYHKMASVTIENDSSNGSGSYILVGNSLITTTQFARKLFPGDWWTVSGSAIDINKIYVLGSTSGLKANISATP